MIRQLLSVLCPALLLSVVCASGQSAYSLPDSLVSLSDSAHIRELVLQEGLYLKSVMRYDEAAEVFASLLQKGSQDSKIIAEIADCNYLDGNYSGARTFYMMLSMSEPDNIVAGIRLMQMSYRCGEYSESIRLGKSILLKDSIPAVCSLVGDAFNRTGQRDSALVYYREALRLRPLYPDVIDKMSDILLSEGQYDEVISLADGYLSERPDNIKINSVKGTALYLKEDYQASMGTFNRMLDLGDDSYGTHLMLGQNLWQLDRVFEAEEELMKAYAIDSAEVGLILLIASVKAELLAVGSGFLKVGEEAYSEMDAWFDKALCMMEPDGTVMSEIWRRRGYAYYRLADWKKSGKCYMTALKYGIPDAQIYLYLGYCSQMEEDWVRALDYYRKGLELSGPDSGLTTYLRERVEDMEREVFMLQTVK